MSMPQPLLVAVVASGPERLRGLTKGAAISAPGVAPRYALVSLDLAAGKRVISLPQLESERVILWVALDDGAEARCRQLHQKNERRPSYSRGFYDTHLLEPVLRVSPKQEFERLVSTIYGTFCATS
jgi:hypothetical protein